MHPLASFKYCPKCGASGFEENNFKSKKCPQCGFIYYFNSSSAVAVIIRNAANEVLVATRAYEPAKGTLDLPGGFVDLDETAEQAAVREVKEETGLRVMNLRYLFSLPNRYVYSNFEVHTVDMFFECSVEQGACPQAEDDVAELKFVSWQRLSPNDFGLASIRKAIALLQQMSVEQHSGGKTT